MIANRFAPGWSQVSRSVSSMGEGMKSILMTKVLAIFVGVCLSSLPRRPRQLVLHVPDYIGGRGEGNWFMMLILRWGQGKKVFKSYLGEEACAERWQRQSMAAGIAF